MWRNSLPPPTILNLRRGSCDFLKARQNPLFHPDIERGRHQRLAARSLCQQKRVIPRVFDHVLGCSCRALNGVCAHPADGEELQVLRNTDTGRRPENWRMSPTAVRTFILGSAQPVQYEGLL